MLNFVARMFRGWMNVLLWLILIVNVIGGFIAGGIALGNWGFHFGYAFLGLIVGGLLGFITIILFGGLIANFLNMVDDINVMKSHLMEEKRKFLEDEILKKINNTSLLELTEGDNST